MALSGRPAELYDAAAGLWGQLRVYLGMALELTGTPGRDVWKTYWAAQQRFFKLLCVSLKVPAVVEQVTWWLGGGDACGNVIALPVVNNCVLSSGMCCSHTQRLGLFEFDLACMLK